MKELNQKSLGRYSFYQIANVRVLVKTRNIDTYEEYSIKFEELGLELRRKQVKGILFCKMVFGLLMALAIYVVADDIQKEVKTSELASAIFMALFFAAFFVYSFLVKTDQVFIQGGSRILQLQGSNPDRQTVDKFVASLQNAIKAHYKKKYAVIDPTLNKAKQIDTYKWLKELDAISEEEYDELIYNLKIRFLLDD